MTTAARTLIVGGMAVAAAIAAGWVMGRVTQPEPRSFAECLLVNARQARTDRALDAIAQSCEDLYRASAATFGDAAGRTSKGSKADAR
jgi:hypothetical protein